MLPSKKKPEKYKIINVNLNILKLKFILKTFFEIFK